MRTIDPEDLPPVDDEEVRRAEERSWRASGSDRERRSHGGDAAAPFSFTVASTLAGIAPPPRRWLVPSWIPDRVTTLLYGDGGTGKSLLALQLMTAAASGTQWLGLPVDRRRVFALFCEDEEDEVHRRLVDVTAAAGVRLDTLDALAWRSLVDEDAILATPDPSCPTSMVPTPSWGRLVATVEEHGARLVVLDTAADIFGGDEIKRAQVRAFLAMLSRLARRIDGAVLVTGHPSVEGMRSGAGTSGSTGWNAGARSRLYLARPEDSGDEWDPHARVLTRKKANMAGIGDTIALRWERGVLAAVGEPAGIDRAALNAKADRIFRDLLRVTYGAAIWVSANPSAKNYAPAVFARRPDRQDLGRAALEKAMHRTLTAGAAKIEQYGRKSNPHHRLAPA
jgi:RecA-family ATPase